MQNTQINNTPTTYSNSVTPKLNLLDATLIVMGSMIGSGIFLVSPSIAQTLGSGGYLLLAWALAGLMSVLGALSYGELAAMMPYAGGQYQYLKTSYGKLPAFLYGWTAFTVIQTGTIAAVAMAFAKHMAVFVPFFSDQNVLFSTPLFNFSGAQILAILLIVFLTYLNTKGLEYGKIIQLVFTTAKVLALLLLIILGITVAKNPAVIAQNFQNFWEAKTYIVQQNTVSSYDLSGIALWSAMGVAMVGSLFSSDAWNNITFISAEVKNPKKVIPMSLIIGVLAVTTLYLLANVAYMCVLPVLGNFGGNTPLELGIQYATNGRVGAAAATQIFGAIGTSVMALLIMVSTFGCNNGVVLASARVYQAMASDGLFFKNMAKLNAKSVPETALWVQMVWSILLCLSGKYNDLLDYVMFAVMLFYIFTIMALFVLRRTQPHAPRPYKAIGYPVLPALYLLMAIGFTVNLLVCKPQFTVPGLLLVLVGIPVFGVWNKKK